MKKKAHVIGICGVGMSGVAKLLKDIGWEVSGSDSDFYPPASTLLKSYDLSFKTGYRKENIPKDVNLIVIGKNAKLTPEENEEVVSFTLKNFPLKAETINLPLKCRPGISSWKNYKFHKDTIKSCRIYPQDNDSEGFFLAKFKLMEEVEE